MNRFKLGLVALVVALGLTTAVAGCSSAVAYPAPASYSVSYMGSCYTGYLYDPDEALMFGVPSTCTRHLFPSYPPAMGSIEWALWNQLLTYDSYYHSGFYYDQVLYPMSVRYHVSVVSKTAYTSTYRDFDTRNASSVKSSSAKAKWSNGKTGNYTFPATNSKAKNKPLTNTKTSTNSKSTNYGTDNSRSGSTGSKSSTTTGRSGTGSSGKSGSTRSGGRR